jgi:hypothetical protein
MLFLETEVTVVECDITTAPSGPGPPHYHTQLDFSERVFSPAPRSLFANTQHSQETDIHARAEMENNNTMAACDIDVASALIMLLQDNDCRKLDI